MRSIEDLLQPLTVAATLFPPNSRYHGIPIATWRRPDGTEVAHLQRRVVPAPSRFAVLREHTVTEGERLDYLASHYIGDPELYWRICDANSALRPDELTERVGRRLRITLPEGIPGPVNA